MSSDPLKVEAAKKSKSKSSRAKQASSNAPRLKVVIRRLPPNLPEAIFWDSVSQWVTDQTVSWKLYVKGKLRTKLNKANLPSRAYVEFKTPDAVVVFNQGYNGHLFRDKQGNESIAVVEYAPFQKAPHPTRKVDSKIGTIEADEDYISFLNALNKPAGPTLDVTELLTQAAPPVEPASTPLLDALKAAKESSTIKGYHSHYREQSSQPRTRAQQIEDEQTFSRKAPLLPKSQQDTDLSITPVEPGPKEDKGKEKEGGGGKKKNKQKAAAAAVAASPAAGSSSKPAPPGQPSSSARTASEPRPRPVLGSRGGLLAAIGAATETRAASSPRKSSGRQREPSGGIQNHDQAATSTPATPLPAGVLAIPGSATAPEVSTTPGKTRRGGKNRGRGRGAGGGGVGGSEEGSSAPPALSEMPRIDDPGQALPLAAATPRGRGGGGRGRGRGGRGRGRGAASGAGDQPGTPATMS